MFVSGIISYGLQFELEQGQFNVFTIFLVVISIYSFHYSKKLKWLSYFIFGVSVNFKISPAVFVSMTTVRVPARPMIKGTILKVLLVAISFFYSAMLYSQDYKPWLLDNNFVMIFFLFLSVISFLILNEGLFKRKEPLTKQ